MTKQEMIDGLKAGGVLFIDVNSAPEIKQAVGDLQDDGLVWARFEIVDDSYSRYRITWNDEAAE